MRFRPCIDIHNGKVKQIVGGTLSDRGDAARENYVSERDASWYASLYLRDGLSGGHVILLNPASSPYYEADRQQALSAVRTAPGTLMVGGGINPDNAEEYLAAGASHVIVTSYVFRDGHLEEERLKNMLEAVGKRHLVLDLSCRRTADGGYRIVTDRWQKFTDLSLTESLLTDLSDSCDEFLVHGVDVEGKVSGPELELIDLLRNSPIPVTYAGGISAMEDIVRIRERGDSRVDFTVGSALDLFGGHLPYEKLASI